MWLAFSLIALAMAAAAAFQFTRLPWLADYLEAQRISAKRIGNRALALSGQPLPGTPELGNLDQRLAASGLKRGAPVFVRIFKREFELELWMRGAGGYKLFATYPICTWSGRLGPKLTTGDKQAPEGVYYVDKTALNPQSRWHRSFNLGFPNAYDRAYGRTGSFLMVHGGCSSAGCYAMTNAVIDEIWALAEGALGKGQARFQVQVMPFRMTAENLARYADHPARGLWSQLKQASDLFEAAHLPPEVRVCNGRYEFSPGSEVNDTRASPIAACLDERNGKARAARS